MSPRIIQLPLSGRDRRHYKRELDRVERLHRDLVLAMAAAFTHAHQVACEEWNARQFIGGAADPSPTIANAIDGGCELLEVECRQCGHGDHVDLTLVIWPRDNQVHTLQRALACVACKREQRRRSRPNLVALRMRETPTNMPPAAAIRQRRGE